MGTSLRYIRNKNKSTATGPIRTFFPSFIGLALRGEDLFISEVAKRLNTRLRSITLEGFLSQDPKAMRVDTFTLKGEQKPVVLSWPRERTMIRELQISSSNLGELRETLALQLDSLFPFKPEEAYFDLYPCTLIKGTEEPALGKKVYLFAVNKKELDDVLKRLEVVGLMPSRIIPAPLTFLPMLEDKVERVACVYKSGESGYICNFYYNKGLIRTQACGGEEDLGENLKEDSPEAILVVGFGDEKLPQPILDTLSGEGLITYLDSSWESVGAALYESFPYSYDFNLLKSLKRRVNYQSLYTVLLTVLLLSLALAIPQIVQIRAERRLNLVESEIEGIKKQAFVLKELEGVARAQKALDLALESRKGHIPKIEVLLELSTLLPGDAWIKGLLIKEDTFELEGWAASLAEVMFLLEDSPIFYNVELVPPVTKGEGKEHFRLKGSILREKAP